MTDQPNRWSLEQDLIDDLRDGERSREALAADPRAAVEAMIGKALPAAVTVKVAFDTPTRFHQVVPFPGHAFLGSLVPPEGEARIWGPRGIAVQVARRAADDPAFLASLRADPTGMARTNLAQVSLNRLTMPDDLEVVLVEEDAETIWLTIPIERHRRARRRAEGRGHGKGEGRGTGEGKGEGHGHDRRRE